MIKNDSYSLDQFLVIFVVVARELYGYKVVSPIPTSLLDRANVS
jgi:hypothetical protein